MDQTCEIFFVIGDRPPLRLRSFRSRPHHGNHGPRPLRLEPLLLDFSSRKANCSSTPRPSSASLTLNRERSKSDGSRSFSNHAKTLLARHSTHGATPTASSPTKCPRCVWDDFLSTEVRDERPDFSKTLYPSIQPCEVKQNLLCEANSYCFMMVSTLANTARSRHLRISPSRLCGFSWG